MTGVFTPSLNALFDGSDLHLDALQNEDESPPHFDGSLYSGELLCLAKVNLTGCSRVLIRNPKDTLTIAIALTGQSSGLVSDRDIRLIPNRISFLLLPQDVLKLSPQSDMVSGYIFRFNASQIISESFQHGIDDPCLSSLIDSLPGHESLLIACANQILGTARDLSSSDRIFKPLESSIFSLLGSLVGPAKVSSSGGLPHASTHSHYVQVAIEYMENNISNHITLSDLCAVCCISARTLQVSFNSVMNRTPLQVLQEIRLTRLRDSLLDGMDVSSACNSLGLISSGRLSASYKKLFGELPRQTRRRC